ncbi:MAG TPA: hypothetical protein VM537_26090 [Anaerolineae bacterium]|nr:hypothetical protein [Anaerolineae bacterium]
MKDTRTFWRCPECQVEIIKSDATCPRCLERGHEVRLRQVWPSRWIPLEEDKPEPWIHVLMLGSTGFWTAGYMDDNDCWWYQDGEGPVSVIIAWMDGPELPEEER